MKLKPVVKYITLGLLAYISFLVASFPAEQALSLVRSQLQGVYVQNIAGTVWRGRIAKLQVGDQVFEQVSWRAQPLSLLMGRLQLDVTFDGVGRSGEGIVSLGADGSVSLEDFQGRVALMDIDHLLGIAPVQLGGLIDVEFDELVWRDKQVVAADGVVHWRGAEATAPMAMKLGDFNVVLTTEESGIKGVVKDGGGVIALDGVATLDPAGNYQFKGHIAARDKSNRMLAQGIGALGRAGADGRVAVEYAGKL